MRMLHRAAGLVFVLLAEVTSTTAGECGVLGYTAPSAVFHAASFRVGAGGSGCVVCGDGNGAPCPASPSPTPDEPVNAQESSVCYTQAAHPTNMALSGDVDVEAHRIPGCSCHASCAKCGYAAMPTGETKCIGASRYSPYAANVVLFATVDRLSTNCCNASTCYAECADPAATLVRTDDWDLYRTGSCGIPIAEDAARCQLTLDADYTTLHANFNAELKADMATIMNIQPRRIDIVTIAPGSIVVTFDVYPSEDESDSTPAESIQLLQTTVAQGTSGEFAGFSAVSLQVLALPDDGDEGSTDLLDQEVVLSMEEVLIIGGSVGGFLLLLVCTLIVRVVCCRKKKAADKYVAPVPHDLELAQAGSQNNSPATSPKSPAAIRRQREAAERAAAQDDDLDPEDASEEEEEDQLSPLDATSYRDSYVEDFSRSGGGGSPSHRREGRARSSSVSSSSGRSHGGGGRSRSGSVSSGGSGRRHDDDDRRSRSGSISSSSHRSRSGSISGSSSSRSRSRSISGASGHRSRSGSISSSGRERSHSDGRRRSVSSKKSHEPLVRTISEDEEIDPREDMLRAVQAHEAAMAAEAETDSPPGSVPHSPGTRSSSHRSRSHSSSRRQSVSRPSRSQSRRDIEREDSYSGED